MPLPGTSACPNGSFYCRNRGHEAKVLSTSFVDDGVCGERRAAVARGSSGCGGGGGGARRRCRTHAHACAAPVQHLTQRPHAVARVLSAADCCDGSDELSGCKNTCIEKNSAKRDALRKKIDELKAALDKKAAYAASAAGVRENIRQRHANVDGDIAKAEAELERLTGARAARRGGGNLACVRAGQPCMSASMDTPLRMQACRHACRLSMRLLLVACVGSLPVTAQGC